MSGTAGCCVAVLEKGLTCNIRPRDEPNPPLEVVSIRIWGLIQLILPDSVIIASPDSNVQTTAGSGSPMILYFILYPSKIGTLVCRCFSKYSIHPSEAQEERFRRFPEIVLDKRVSAC